MKFRYSMFLSTLLGVLSLRAQEPPRSSKVDRLCGFVQQEKQLPDKRHPNSSQYANTAVEKVPLRLYPREGTEACCSQGSPIAETRTEKNGKFAFKKTPGRNYWIAVIDKGEYKIQIEYKPAKEYQSDCEEYLYTLDRNGSFVLKSFVTVTVA